MMMSSRKAPFSFFWKREYLLRAHEFYEKHGGKTIFLARFIPIIRTFAPFVAGVGNMTYRHFITYNVVGGIVWPILFISAGYFFGNIPFVKSHLEKIIWAMILIPGVVAIFGAWRGGRRKAVAG